MAGSTILGISPGTKYVGIAVLRNGYLHDWKVKTYKGVWSNEKLAKAIEYLESLVITQAISKMACKVPVSQKSSAGLNELIIHIKSLALEYGIELFIYSMDELKSLFKISISNKEELAHHIADKFPEIMDSLKALLRSRHKYHIKMFEAIAATVHCHNAIKY